MAVRKRRGSRFYWYEFQLNGHRFRGSTKAETREAMDAIETKTHHDLLMQAATGKKTEITLDTASARYWLDHVTVENNRPEAQQFAIRSLQRGLGKATLLSETDTSKDSEFIARRRGDGRTPGTINREVKILRAIMNRAGRVLNCSVARPDWKKLMLSEPEPQERAITTEEAGRLTAAAAPHLKSAIRAALLTGVGKENIVKLDWRQIDLQGRTIEFRVKAEKPGRKRHTVPISEPLLMLLLSLDPKPRGRVFLRKEWRAPNGGKMVPIGDMKRAFAGACRRAGLVPEADDPVAGIRLHDLRHTAASWMVQDGVPLGLSSPPWDIPRSRQRSVAPTINRGQRPAQLPD